MQNLIISCDWGTSSFRLKAVDVQTHQTLGEMRSGNGIAATFQLWKQCGEQENISREHFYLRELHTQIESLANRMSVSLSQIPVVISGMASSSIGIRELPYALLPFSIDGSDAIVHALVPDSGSSHEVWIISGARNEVDVMRGEEVQVVGLAALDKTAFYEERSVCIFPGTHSKHITVEGGKISDCSTFMTGELFGLVSQHSILRDSISECEEKQSLNNSEQDAFCQGVEESKKRNLLHTLFSVRLNHLFRRLTREENFFYLSGLMIGTELITLQNTDHILLCSGSRMNHLYEAAIEKLNLWKRTRVIQPGVMDNTASEGHLAIFKNRILQSR